MVGVSFTQSHLDTFRGRAEARGVGELFALHDGMFLTRLRWLAFSFPYCCPKFEVPRPGGGHGILGIYRGRSFRNYRLFLRHHVRLLLSALSSCGTDASGGSCEYLQKVIQRGDPGARCKHETVGSRMDGQDR